MIELSLGRVGGMLLGQVDEIPRGPMGVLSALDVVIFFASLVAVMAMGLWAGRKEEDAADYYLAGRKTRWWGVAGSIFGSNVSANHLVGMMGVGFSIGFAQSHFEITAIAGLLILCYGFLPIYRKLNVYTLSEYLSRRYSDASRIAYAIIMVIIMVIIQMVPGFYIGSRSINELLQGGPGPVDPTYYTIGILGMAAVTGTYVIVGGLKAVIVTDVIQSILLLIAGLIVAVITFAQPEIGGWTGMLALDSAEGTGVNRMHLDNSSDYPGLPWTGVLSGLMVLHFYYWGTNQFIVQRALSARSDSEAKIGIITAGFFKLLIPFFSIGTGIAAFYLFRERSLDIQPDAVFSTLLSELVAPIGFGLVGLIAAGVIGALLSSIDSMLNSAATIVTFDLYKRYINPQASEQRLIWYGRVCIVVFIVLSASLTIFVMDPNSKENFFLQIASHQSKVVAGLVVAFAVGMFWKRATAAGSIAAIVTGVVLSYGLPHLYTAYCRSGSPSLVDPTTLNVAGLATYEIGEPIRIWVAPKKEPLAATPPIDPQKDYFIRTLAGGMATLHLTETALKAGTAPLEFDVELKKDEPPPTVALYAPERKSTVKLWGPDLHFMHSVFLAAVAALLLHIIVSLLTQPDKEKSKLTWVGLGVIKESTLKTFLAALGASLCLYAVLGGLMVVKTVTPTVCAFIAAGWTLVLILTAAVRHTREHGGNLLANDRFWAAFLAATAIFMMYYFY